MTQTRILQLTLKKEWFDKVLKEGKRREYRKPTKYWRSRLEGREYDKVRIRNGYLPKAREIHIQFKGIGRDRRTGEYVIRFGRILKRKHLHRKG